MQKYEYKVLKFQNLSTDAVEEELNKYGRLGWEVASTAVNHEDLVVILKLAVDTGEL